MRRQVEAEIVDDLLRFLDHGALLQEAEARILLAEEHVGGDRQMPAEHDFLVHGVDAERHRLMRGRQRRRLAFPDDLAGGARHDAGQKLDQGGFAGAVLADDGVDFAGLEGEVDRLQRMGAGIVLFQAAQFEDRPAGLQHGGGMQVLRRRRHDNPPRLASRLAPGGEALDMHRRSSLAQAGGFPSDMAVVSGARGPGNRASVPLLSRASG